jgi:hypothetical protein
MKIYDEDGEVVDDIAVGKNEFFLFLAKSFLQRLSVLTNEGFREISVFLLNHCIILLVEEMKSR